MTFEEIKQTFLNKKIKSKQSINGYLIVDVTFQGKNHVCLHAVDKDKDMQLCVHINDIEKLIERIINEE